MNTYPDFIRGRFQGISLSRDGRLTLAPKIETVFSSDQPVVWAWRKPPDGGLYVAPDTAGRVFRSTARARARCCGRAEQPEIFALAMDSARRALRRHFAGRQGLPHRKRARPPNISRRRPSTSGRWPRRRMARSTWARATRARFIAWKRPARASCITTPGSRTSPGWRWTARAGCWRAREPNGILYRITGQGQSVRAVRRQPAGDSRHRAGRGRHRLRRRAGWFAGQARAERHASEPGGGCTTTVTTSPTTITVEAQNAQPGARDQAAAGARQAAAPAATPQVTTQFTPVVDMAGVEKSAVYKINPGQHGRDALEFQGRERLRPAGAGKPDSFLHRRQRAHLRPLAGPQGHAGGANQRGGSDTPAARRAFGAGRYRQHGPHLPAGRAPRRDAAVTNRRCTMPAPPRNGAA